MPELNLCCTDRRPPTCDCGHPAELHTNLLGLIGEGNGCTGFNGEAGSGEVRPCECRRSGRQVGGAR